MTSSNRLPLKSQDPNVPPTEILLPQKHETNRFEQLQTVSTTKPISDDSVKIDVPYFRKRLIDERKKLTALCEIWDDYLSNLKNVDSLEVIMGDIRSVVGQARLVMAERFTQFEGLVDNCEFGTSEKPVTCIDLQGFWDMIFFQVEDVIEKFANLQKRKDNNWKCDELTHIKRKKVLKKCKKRSSSETAAAAARTLAARKRLAAARAAMKKDNEPPVTFDAGFFNVASPARVVSEKPNTPSNRLLKKTVTPSSGNFMHGRFIRKALGSTSRKSLQFEIVSEMPPEKASCIPEIVVKPFKGSKKSDSNVQNPVAENKENFNPSDCSASAAELKESRDRTTTVGTLTDPWDYSVFGSAIDAISGQMQILSGALKADTLNELQNKVASLKRENSDLKSEIAELKKNNSADSLAPFGGDNAAYEVHYKRLREKNKILESELSAYNELSVMLVHSKVEWKNTFKLFFKKVEEVNEFYEYLQTKNEELKKKESKENEEIARLKQENSDQKEEISSLSEKVEKYELLTTELESLKEVNEQLKVDYQELRKNEDFIREEKDFVIQKYADQCDKMDTLEKNLRTCVEERTFEQEEFSNEKAFFDEEKSLLQSQLQTTEETLQSTTEVLRKVKDKVKESQNEVDLLKSELEKTKEEMEVLREETDITKVNSRLAIVNQQQEVIDCETKLRQLLDTMAEFLLRLKKSSEKLNCEDLPLLSDHPLKTPSKSIVVSALLRHDSQTSVSEWSPEEKFEKKSEACLFGLVNDVTSVMTNIMTSASEVALKHELDKKQLEADKSTLRSRVDSLKQEISVQTNAERDVEVSLRRRLLEVMAERDELRKKHTAEKN